MVISTTHTFLQLKLSETNLTEKVETQEDSQFLKRTS